MFVPCRTLVLCPYPVSHTIESLYHKNKQNSAIKVGYVSERGRYTWNNLEANSTAAIMQRTISIGNPQMFGCRKVNNYNDNGDFLN